jgi:hypothetical protein
MVVPLARQEQTLGMVVFARTDPARPYTAEDLELARELARRAAIAVENARLHQEVREANRRKVEFLAMLAHELRNPLAAISNDGYTLEQTLSEGGRTPRLVGAVTRQAKHLARLVEARPLSVMTQRRLVQIPLPEPRAAPPCHGHYPNSYQSAPGLTAERGFFSGWLGVSQKRARWLKRNVSGGTRAARIRLLPSAIPGLPRGCGP